MSTWFQKPIPRTLFHGSLYKHLESIKRHGLNAGTLERANFPDFKEDVVGHVSLADTETAARRFAVFSLAGSPKAEHDFIILIIDSLSAQARGARIIPMRGKLSSDYGGHEYLAIGDIPRESIVGADRFHYVGGQLVKDYIRL